MNDKDIPRIRKEIEERLAVYTKNDLNEALADQKTKIREWLLINCKKDGFCILNKEGLKKFKELK